MTSHDHHPADVGGAAAKQRDVDAAAERERQQAAIAALGSRALSGGPLEPLLDDAVERLADTLRCDLTKIFRLEPDGQSMALVAGRGWREGLVGQLAVGAQLSSQAGYTLKSGGPIIVTDLERDQRFGGLPLLIEHQVRSGMTTIIGPPTHPWGVLGVHSREMREFSANDLNILQAVANLLYQAIRRRENEQKLFERGEMLRLSLQAAGMGTSVYNPADHSAQWDTQQYRLFERSPDLPAPSIDELPSIVHPDDGPHVKEAAAATLAGAGPYKIEFRVRQHDGTWRWLAGHGDVVSTDGWVRMVGVTYDISDRKALEERQRLLNRELSHRVKNTLAVIQSIARHTLRSTPDPEIFAEAFQGRIQALANAHDILTQTNWAGVDLRQLIRQQVMPYSGKDEGRLVTDGIRLVLHPEIATALSLVLHELATNATKYGALSAPAGQVLLSWTLDTGGDIPVLILNWAERGGPIVKQPVRMGFGSHLIARSGAKVDIRYEPSGLTCRVEIPLQQQATS